MKSHIFAMVFLCLIFNVAAKPKKMACPKASEIDPIKCVETQTKVSITVDSRSQSQSDIAKSMDKIRTASKVTAEESLETFNFYFQDVGSSVPSLDLGILGKIRIQTLEFHGKFPKIISTDSSDQRAKVISVKDLNILNSTECSAESLNNALSSFDMPKLERLHVKNPYFSGFPTLLPKLSGLETLIFEQCNITTLEAKQFRGNPNLKFMGLHKCHLREIQKDAFDFGPNRAATVTKFYIYNNPIEESGINSSHGLAQLKGEIWLTLENTKITSLSEKTWKEYLQTERKHRLIFRKNPLVCSPAMKWLKNEKKRLERQVENADCSNDEGKTVFDSKLV